MTEEIDIRVCLTLPSKFLLNGPTIEPVAKVFSPSFGLVLHIEERHISVFNTHLLQFSGDVLAAFRDAILLAGACVLFV